MYNLNWASLHCHSSFSLLDGFADPKAIAKRCKELGYKAAALTDHGSIAGCVQFSKHCKEIGIKPILGCEFYVCQGPATQKDKENRSLSHAVILSKNLKGWYEMIQAISISELPEHSYFHNRVDFAIMKQCLGNGNHFCIIGHPGTDLSNCLFSGKEIYDCNNADEVAEFLHADWKDRANAVIDKYLDIFGENLRIEIQLIDQDNLPVSIVIAKCLRQIVAESNGKLKPVATADSHYVNKADAMYQRILLCSGLGRTMGGVERDLSEGKPVPLRTFFISDNYHIPSLEELIPLHTAEEISNAYEVGELCEDYEILKNPILPRFECPDGKDEFEYLTELCRIGWKNILLPTGRIRTEADKNTYVERIKEELQVIKDAGLSGYFLIVQDIIRFCREKGWLPGIGRGSAAGCLISYLVGITGVDPIPYNLLFSRFYNAGRSAAGTLPDIDMDVPTEHRDEIIEYIKNKYGRLNVSQMVTFGSLMGKSAVKEVFRICGNLSFAEMNDITKDIPDKSTIEDEMKESGETSVIKWTLTYRPKILSRWCSIDNDGNLSGDLADLFEKAIRIEGTPKSRGKHAAGVIISASPLSEICPMVMDKEGNAVAGFEMGDLEAIGQVKFDVLGVTLLDKVDAIQKYGKLNINDFEDQNVWDMLGSGDTKGIFQIERQSRWTKMLKPTNMHHLSALIAIIRPGVSEAMLEGKSMTQHYIDRKNGLEETTYLHPSLEPILKDTYGIIVFQESAMLIARQLAGFTLDEADALRKAIGKKNIELMAIVRKQFLEGAEKVGIISHEEAVKIFDWIEKSQRYSFNASHSYVYAICAYYSAYCKYYEPVKFYEVCLNFSHKSPDSQEEIRELVNDAKLRSISIIPPRLGTLHENFTMEGDGIHFGVSHIKDVGVKDVAALFGSGKDLSNYTWMELLLEFGGTVNKKAFKALCTSGAFCGANNKLSRNRMAYEHPIFKKLTPRELAFVKENLAKTETLAYHINMIINNFKVASNRLKVLMELLGILNSPMYALDDEPSWIARSEKFYFGISLTCSATDFSDTSTSDCTCKDIRTGMTLGGVTIAVTVNKVREHKIKKGKKSEGQVMAFLSVDDSSAELNSVIIFPEEYKVCRQMLFEDNTVLLQGKAENKNGDVSLIVEKVFQI